MEVRTQTQTQSADSIFGQIAFGGTKVPIGFLTSFAKSSHTNCMGRGFTTQTVGDKKVRHICSCTVNRAAKKLRQVGAAGFTMLGDEWATKMRTNPESLPEDLAPATSPPHSKEST